MSVLQRERERRDDRSRFPNLSHEKSTAEPPADEPIDGRSPMPQRSQPEPASDLLPLAKFLIGLDEASKEYRRNADDLRREDVGETSEKDPWKENVFHRPRPAQPPLRQPKEPHVPASERPKSNGDPQANSLNSDDNSKSEEQALLDSFWRQCPSVDPPLLSPRASAGGDSTGVVLGALLASVISYDRSPDQSTSRSRGLASLIRALRHSR